MKLPHHRRTDLYSLMQNVTVKAYWLTDFKKFAFSANRCFVRTGGNQQAIPIVFVIK
jgi:hypothetical protein